MYNTVQQIFGADCIFEYHILGVKLGFKWRLSASLVFFISTGMGIFAPSLDVHTRLKVKYTLILTLCALFEVQTCVSTLKIWGSLIYLMHRSKVI